VNEPFDSLVSFLPPAQLGFGGVAGFVAGYAAKKIARVVALILGLLFFAVQILAYEGWITIHWGAVQESAHQLWSSAGGQGSVAHLWSVLTDNLPFGAAFTAGFAIGFKLA
jgi:uncharacterized membrane protein (Fun14 family)